MSDEKYEAIKTLVENQKLIDIATKERMETEKSRITYALQLMRETSGKSSLQSDIADATSRLATAVSDLGKAAADSPEWKSAEGRRRTADADLYNLNLDAEDTIESAQVKIGHLLEVAEAVLAIKDAHIAKLEARKRAIIEAGG